MKYGKHLSKQMKDPEFLKVLAQEGLIIDIQEEICGLMKVNNISRVELTKRMGKTKGFMTQILNSGRNLTLRTIADIFVALRIDKLSNDLDPKFSEVVDKHFWDLI